MSIPSSFAARRIRPAAGKRWGPLRALRAMPRTSTWHTNAPNKSGSANWLRARGRNFVWPPINSPLHGLRCQRASPRVAPRLARKSLRCGCIYRQSQPDQSDYWGVESSLHHRLDVSALEDKSRVRQRNNGEVLAMMRRASVSITNAWIAKERNPRQANLPGFFDARSFVRV